jgi:hypothetical protein
MARTCIFCGGTPVTSEHLWPQWIQRDVYAGVTSFKHSYDVGDGSPIGWGALGIDVKVRAVCADCNNGWMATLESDARALLLPMVFGRYTQLHADEQALLTRWAAKTALVFQAMHGEYLAAMKPHLDQVYQHGLPLPGSWVWLARFDPSSDSGYMRTVNLWESKTGVTGDPVAFATAFNVRQVVLLVYMQHPRTRHIDLTGPARQVFPLTGTIRWPLRRWHNAEQFVTLTDMFVGA